MPKDTIITTITTHTHTVTYTSLVCDCVVNKKSSHQYQLFNVDARLNGCTARVPLSPALALSRSVAPLTANH